MWLFAFVRSHVVATSCWSRVIRQFRWQQALRPSAAPGRAASHSLVTMLRRVCQLQCSRRRALHMTVGPRTVELVTSTLDLHAGGAADGEPGAHVVLVQPKDWRDVPHSRDNPPFWVLPWPSGSALAALLMRNPELVRGKRVIDVGCGVAPAGLAAARAGAANVVLSDRDECAMACALQGGEANGVSDVCSTHPLDWSNNDLDASLCGAFDVALACDLFYDESSSNPLPHILHQLLRPDGTLLVGLPVESEYRGSDQASTRAAEASLNLLQEAGFSIESQEEAQGAQLPGAGPEGLAAARRVMLARLVRRGAAGYE